MSKRAYLEGATPYPPDVIEEYAAKGWWLNLTYGDLLDRSTSLYPDKLAVIDERTQLTYAQLKEKVDRLAIAFLKLGIREVRSLAPAASQSTRVRGGFLCDAENRGCSDPRGSTPGISRDLPLLQGDGACRLDRACEGREPGVFAFDRQDPRRVDESQASHHG